ncbi:MAG: hypothetical protein HF973_10165 [Chloroflexi bacterium]|nr:hypothetical protein [Chloroflexota bacterium]
MDETHYQRYKQLLQVKRDAPGPYLAFPNRSPEAQRKGKILADQVRNELQIGRDKTLEEAMVSLRGRA